MFFQPQMICFVAHLVDVDIEYYSPCLFFIMITVVVMIIFLLIFTLGESLQTQCQKMKKKLNL